MAEIFVSAQECDVMEVKRLFHSLVNKAIVLNIFLLSQ
jgi:hypothetical protein